MSRDDYSMIPTRIFLSNHGLLTRIDDVIGQVVMVIMMTSEDKKSILLTRTDDVIGQVVMVIVMTS